MSKYDWNNAATKILKSEMIKRSMTNQDLADALVEIGLKESATMVQNKLYRGTFSATFFLQCLKAMQVTQINVSDDFFMPKKNIS